MSASGSAASTRRPAGAVVDPGQGAGGGPPGAAAAVPTLLISGTVGSGKSTVAAAVSDALAAARIPNAAVDLDALIWQWPPSSPWNQDLLFDNLAVLWPNYRASGVRRLVLARVLEDVRDLDRYRAAVPGAAITVCRLTAPRATRVERLRRRMVPGPDLDWHLARTDELESILAGAALEDFVIETDGRAPSELAAEILRRSGWVAAG